MESVHGKKVGKEKGGRVEKERKEEGMGRTDGGKVVAKE